MRRRGFGSWVLATLLFGMSASCFAQTNYTGLWWNSAEAGWGLNTNHQGNTIFATLFTYDEGGNPMWLVMSAGTEQSQQGNFVGDLYRTTGANFNVIPFPPPTSVTRVGTMSLAFSSATSGTLTYTYNGVTVTKAIQQQVFGSRVPACSFQTGARTSHTTYQDLWWNPAQPGWGLNLAHQDNTLFGTLFTYGAYGDPMWLVMSAGQRQPDGSYHGDLFRTSGPAFNSQPFTPVTAANLSYVGVMQLRFTNGEVGTLTYTVEGVTVTKPIVRQTFGTTFPNCVMPPEAKAQICSSGGSCGAPGQTYTVIGSVQASVIGASQTTLDSYSIRAVDGPLTIDRVTASDTNGAVVPIITGVREGQIIAAGQSASFSLISPLTRGRLANLRFLISANRKSVFDATYQFRSN